MRPLLLLSLWIPILHAQVHAPRVAAGLTLPGDPPVQRALPVDDDGAVTDTPLRPQISQADLAKLPPKSATPVGEDALRVQIFLDQANFGPGMIDGKPGQFTQLAAKSWNEAHGYPSASWHEVVAAAHASIQTPLATAIVPESSKEWIDESLPTKYSEQAKRKRMSYRSMAEYLAERYHSSPDYIIALNGAAKIKSLKPGDQVVVPNVAPFLIETITGKKYEKDEKLSQRHVVVDTKAFQVRIYEGAPTALVVEDPEAEAPARANRNLVAAFPITPGQPQFIRYGMWTLQNQVEWPWWRYDPSLLDKGVRGDSSINIPPGPNSPVGILWCGTNKTGIGMHGTSDSETIGRARSHGCIRLANWDAVRLPTLIRPGASVEIR